MIVVDTSVWVDALRHGQGRSAATLRGLLDADEAALPLPVRIELLSGASHKDRGPLKRALSGLAVLAPTDSTWSVIERWVETSANAGQRFSLTDLLIAALADEVGGLIWSLDDDFARMGKLKMVRLYA